MMSKQRIELKTVTFEWDESTGKSRTKLIGNAVQSIARAYVDGWQKFAVAIPPRVGKSNVMYAVAQELRVAYGAPIVIAVAPWTILAKQLRDKKKWLDHDKHYPTTGGRFVVGEAKLDAGWEDAKDSSGNPYTLYTTTIAKAQLNKRVFINGFLTSIENTRKRPVMFIDECQLLRDSKPWGELYSAAVKAGVFVVVMTGTPYRADKKPLPGFEYETGEQSSTERFVVTNRFMDDNGNAKGVRQKLQVDTQEKIINPDFEIAWSEAWECNAMCRLTAIYVDTDVTIEDKKTGVIEQKQLSELSADVVRKSLRGIVESSDFVQRVAEVTIDRLIASKAEWGAKRPQWMVMAGSDFDVGESENQIAVNRHARSIQRALQEVAERRGRSDIRVKVASLANADSDPSNLDDFKKGEVDILIVKMMGVVGLDMDTIAGCTLLSTVRQGPTWAQFITRCATVRKDGKAKVGQLILPKDVLCQEQFKMIVTDQGGETKVVESTVLDELIVDIDTDSKASVDTKNSHVSGYMDSKLNAYSGDQEKLIASVRKLIPISATDPEIIDLVRRGLIVVPTDVEENEFHQDDTEKFGNATDEAAEMRNVFNVISSNFASARSSYGGGSGSEWVSIRKEFVSKCKKLAGVHPSIALDEIRDNLRLRKIVDIAKQEASRA